MFTQAESPSTRQPKAPVELENVIGGRGLQAVGLISLFLSAAFFFKLAVDHGWIPPELRVLIGLVAGAALLVTGVLMHRRPAGNRAIVEGLLGLGGALCYLSLWAAGPLFDLVPSVAAFGGMSVVTCVLTILAARHRSQLTALYGVIGGLLTPAFLPHAGQQILLGSYLLALCGGMVKLAGEKRFRLVPGVAFLGSLAYAPLFVIDGSCWTYVHNLVLSSLFFLEFGAALFIIERRKDTISKLDVVLSGLNIAAYIGILEIDLAGHHVTLTAALLLLCAALAWAASKTRGGNRVESLYLWSATASIALAAAACFWDQDSLTCAAFAVAALAVYAGGTYFRRSSLKITGALLATVTVPLGVFTLCATAPESVQVFGSLTPSFPERIGTFAVMALALFCMAAVAGRNSQHTFGKLTESDVADFAVTLANLVAIVGLANVFYSLPAAFGVSFSQEQVMTSVGWTLYAAAMFTVGLRRDSRLLRWSSLALFVLTIGKVVGIDLASLELIDRVAVCFGLGIATLVVSAIYLRRSHAAQVIEGD
jgi:uncharacterized membrane protein